MKKPKAPVAKSAASVYNPLDKLSLAKSIEAELLARPVDPLSAIDHVPGAGVYATSLTLRAFG